METECDLVLPCRDEAAALLDLLPTVPAGFNVVVVDNGSRDHTAEVARRCGATVVHEPLAGYGAAVHAGLLAATGEYVAFMDGDGSFDARDLPALLDDVRSGRADLAVGRRRPVARGVWPWHARARQQPGRLVAAPADRDDRPRHRADAGLPPHGAARAGRAGPQVRLPGRAAPEGDRAGWRLSERDVGYHPRALGTRSKVSGSVRGTTRAARDFWRVLA